MIEEYELGHKVGWFVTDNASNNNICCDAVTKHFFPHFTERQRKARRLRCLGHVLNLAAKAFLYGKDVDTLDLEEVIVNSDLQKELKHGGSVAL